MDKTFLKDVIREFLKAIRGKHSQETLNKKFGFSFNQIYKWEKGATKISWPELVILCQFCHIPLTAKMETLFIGLIDMKSDKKEDSIESRNLIKFLMGNMTIDKFSKKYGLPRNSVSKWLSGQAHPTLEQMLFLFHYHAGQLIKFLDSTVGAKNIPSLKDIITKLQIRESITYKYPEVSLILNTMHTKAFKAKKEVSEGYFAKKFGLTIPEVNEIFNALLESDTIQAYNASYRMNKYDVFKINANVEQMSKRYIRYFQLIAKNLDRGELKAPQNFFSHIVFPSNLKQAQELKKVLKKMSNDFFLQISDETDIEDFDKLMIMTIALCQVD